MLTPKQKIVMHALKAFMAKTGKSPSLRELQAEMTNHGLTVKSVRSVQLYVKELEEMGYLVRSRRGGLTLYDEKKKRFADIPVYSVSVPILGAANAGTPALFAEENLEGYLTVSKDLARGQNVFAVQVSGTSMDSVSVRGNRIEDGDYILVDYGNYNEEDDIVLAIIDGLATVKHLKRMDGDTLGLFPESGDASHRPIYLTPQDDFVINGHVVGVLKNPSAGDD